MTPEFERIRSVIGQHAFWSSGCGHMKPPEFKEAMERVTRDVLAALKELPLEGNAPRYTAGEWSRRNIEAFVEDVLK